MTDRTDGVRAATEQDQTKKWLWLQSGQGLRRRAAGLSVVGSLLWPVQAAVVAFALGSLLSGSDVAPLWIAVAFAALGGLRAVIGAASETYAQAGADAVVQDARSHIVAVEATRTEDAVFGGAGSISALASEKLDLLAPYITRYAPARARAVVVPVVIFALALWHSWAVALIFLISGPLIPVFMALVGMAAKDASRRQMAEVGTMNDLLVERLSALIDIRLLGANEIVLAGFSAQAGAFRNRTMAVLRVAFLSSTVLELFAAIGVAMVAVYVGFSLLGALDFGTWGAGLTPQAGIFILLLAPEFYQPLRDLSAAWHDKAAADAVLADLAEWQADESGQLLGKGGKAVPLVGAASISLQGCVLPNGLILPDIDIAAGERVALMGPSGAGKTSMLRVIAGGIEPAAGIRLVANQMLDDSKADAWRARIGWMPQNPHFLNASLQKNVTLGRTGDLDRALKQAAVAEVVASLPQGLQTRLGETGAGLSGGEARRLTLARAIYGGPDVILADEPTADLDGATAQLVADGLLEHAGKGATIVIATHDGDLAARMDRIIWIGDPS